MQSNPLISIIVPVYNTVQYIHRCIDSILAQTYPHFELLLIDDGATDGSGDLCDEYLVKDTRIRVFHKENGGVSSARNLGLDNAIGNWITFADSDDFLKEDWILDYVSEIVKDPKVGLAYQGIIKLKDGVEVIDQYIENRIFKEDEILTAYMYLDREVSLFGLIGSKMYRADIFQQNKFRFDLSISFCEDLELTFRFLQKVDHVAVINRFNYVYVLDRDFSLSRRFHSYDTLSKVADITMTQLKILNNRTDEVCDKVFDSVYYYRFRALKNMYKTDLIKTSLERRQIIKTYYTHYYADLNKLEFSQKKEKIIVKILLLKSARLIDIIYRVLFTLKK